MLLEHELRLYDELIKEETYGNQGMYSLRIMNVRRKLSKLTKNKKPKDVMDEMVMLSNLDGDRVLF